MPQKSLWVDPRYVGWSLILPSLLHLYAGPSPPPVCWRKTLQHNVFNPFLEGCTFWLVENRKWVIVEEVLFLRDPDLEPRSWASLYGTCPVPTCQAAAESASLRSAAACSSSEHWRKLLSLSPHHPPHQHFLPECVLACVCVCTRAALCVNLCVCVRACV